MDSQHHPDHVVNLRSSLEDGLPLPSFVIAELRSRDEDVDIVIETTEAHVRLTTNDQTVPQPNERMVSLVPPNPIRSSIYPGLTLNNR